MQCQLALHLGRTLGELSETMTERELGIWLDFRQKHSFPFRRQEYYLAQIALMVARHAGVEGVTIKDFLFDPEQPQQPMTEPDIAHMVQEMTRG